VLPCTAVIPTPDRLPGSQQLLPGQHCSLAVIYSQRRDEMEQQEGGGERRQRFRASVAATEQSPLFQALHAAAAEGGGDRPGGSAAAGQQRWYAVPLTTLATWGRAFMAVQTMVHRGGAPGALLQEVMLAQPAAGPAAPLLGAEAVAGVRSYCQAQGLDASQAQQVEAVALEVAQGNGPQVGRRAGPKSLSHRTVGADYAAGPDMMEVSRS
jgi:hypothetical protein